MTPAVNERTSLLIYDGDCGFCTTTANWISARVLRSTSSIQPWQALDLSDYDLSEADVSTASYWVDASGATHRGERGIAAMLAEQRSPWTWVGRFLMLPGIAQLAHVVYGVIAKNRQRLPGATDACRIPN